MYERLERLLEQRGVTAYHVAKETGIAQPNFSRWKQGVAPGVEMLMKLAKYFGVPMEYFLESDVESNVNNDVDIDVGAQPMEPVRQDGDTALLQVLWILKGLDERDIQRIIDFAAGIKADRKLARTG